MSKSRVRELRGQAGTASPSYLKPQAPGAIQPFYVSGKPNSYKPHTGNPPNQNVRNGVNPPSTGGGPQPHYLRGKPSGKSKIAGGMRAMTVQRNTSPRPGKTNVRSNKVSADPAKDRY